jgi:hypothetical protein
VGCIHIIASKGKIEPVEWELEVRRKKTEKLLKKASKERAAWRRRLASDRKR